MCVSSCWRLCFVISFGVVPASSFLFPTLQSVDIICLGLLTFFNILRLSLCLSLIIFIIIIMMMMIVIV